MSDYLYARIRIDLRTWCDGVGTMTQAKLELWQRLGVATGRGPTLDERALHGTVSFINKYGNPVSQTMQKV